MAGTKTATKAPTRKALSGAAGAGVANQYGDIFIYFLELALRHPLPPEIATDIKGLFIFAVALAAAYLMPPASDEGAIAK